MTVRDKTVRIAFECSYDGLPIINPYDYMRPEPTIAERMAALVNEHKDKIPDWAKWIAVDMDGHEHEPEITGGNVFGLSSEKVVSLANPDTLDSFLLEHWKETLTELPTIKPRLTVETRKLTQGEAEVMHEALQASGKVIDKGKRADNMAKSCARDGFNSMTGTCHHTLFARPTER
jgi:hypothetical protein